MLVVNNLTQSIKAKLKASDEMPAKLAEIYEVVPKVKAYPHIALDEADVSDVSSLTEKVFSIEFKVKIYSRARDQKESHEILQAVHDELNHADLSVEGFDLLNISHEFTDTKLMRDEVTHETQARFKVILKQN